MLEGEEGICELRLTIDELRLTIGDWRRFATLTGFSRKGAPDSYRETQRVRFAHGFFYTETQR